MRTVREAVEALYDVFGGYPLRPWTDPCAHCHTEQDERAVHRVPLRELTVEDLRGYTADSLMTWGDLGDLKHFLPRILEIAAAEGGFDFPDVEMVYGHLAYGALHTWPAHERAAVHELAAAHWRAAVTSDVGLESFEPVLTGIMLIEDDLTAYLTWWERSEDPVALANLAEYATEVGRIRGRGRGWNAYLAVGREDGPYGTVRPGPGQVVAWLTGPALIEGLAARCGTLRDPAAEEALDAAILAVADVRP